MNFPERYMADNNLHTIWGFTKRLGRDEYLGFYETFCRI